MKKTDIALIIVIASISAGLAYLAATLIFGKTEERQETIQTVSAIDVETPMVPDKAIFYEGAINPSVQVEIEGDETNSLTTINENFSGNESFTDD